MNVFLTGGTGLVGWHVARSLRARGDRVVALVRSGSDVAALEALGVSLVQGDVAVDEGSTIAAAAGGCDAFVHGAAIVGRRASWEAFENVNVRGTARVLDAAVAVGASRFVQISSVAVYGGATDAPVTEDRWLESEIEPSSYYARSKREAEAVAWRYHGSAGLEVSAVRPCVVYGEHDRNVIPRLDRVVRMPIVPLPAGGRVPLPLVYAGNVAKGIVACLDRPEAAAGRAYNLAGDHPLTARELIHGWCAMRDIRPPRLVTLPGPIISGAAFLGDAIGRLPGVRMPKLKRPARLLRAAQPYDSTRARTELEWTDLVAPGEALRRAAEWMAESEREEA